MNEPAGWQWIEAWRNGTISKEEFTALQNLLREDSDARRTLRRYMAMETALHDRAETRVLLSQSQPANDTAPSLLVTAPDSRFLTRTVVGWSTAAVCVLVAGLVWFTSPTARPKRPLMVETEPQIDGDRESGRRTTAVVSTIAQQRAHLLASAPDVLHLQLVSDEGGYVAQETGGDIALAVQIKRNGQNPADFGFNYVRLDDSETYSPSSLGFQNSIERDAAFEKWSAFIKREVPQKRP